MTDSTRVPEIPIVCTLDVFSRDELNEHLTLALDVLFRLPKSLQERDDGFELAYEGNEQLFLKLARFAYDEHRCCPWASFAVFMDPFASGSVGALRLRYIGGVVGTPVLREALEHFRVAAQDPNAEKRLRDALGAFGTIDLDNKASFYDKMAGNSQGMLDKLRSACGC